MTAAGSAPEGGGEGSAPAHAPVGDTELHDILTPLRRYRAVVLAVSGGSDSMALLLLAARWRDLLAGEAPPLMAVTVDHRLRPASIDEARLVGEVAGRLGIAHEIVAWAAGGGTRPRARLQEAARAARYELLAGVARAQTERPVAVVTAHTADDQAETFVMRLKRGSGLDGLAGIPECRRIARGSDIDLVRPLLGLAKSRLVATLKAAGIAWVEDPSNEDATFERVRIRQDMARLAELGIGAAALAESARRLARARAALGAATASLLEGAADVHGGAYATMSRNALAEAPQEIRLRALATLVARFGGLGGPARLDQLEGLAERATGAAFRGETLGGAVVRARQGHLVVCRESGRSALPEMTLDPGQEAVWDGRFRVSVAVEARSALTVGALGAVDYRRVRSRIAQATDMPDDAAATLPAFRDGGGEVVAVPQLGPASPAEDAGRMALASQTRSVFIWP